MNIQQARMISEDLGGEQTFNGVVLPCFVKVSNGVIGWNPAPSSGDHALDVTLGEIYADIAVAHARETKDHHFLSFVVTSIHQKVFRGEIQYAGLEEGFLDRLARLAYVGSLN